MLKEFYINCVKKRKLIYKGRLNEQLIFYLRKKEKRKKNNVKNKIQGFESIIFSINICIQIS